MVLLLEVPEALELMQQVEPVVRQVATAQPVQPVQLMPGVMLRRQSQAVLQLDLEQEEQGDDGDQGFQGVQRLDVRGERRA